MKNKGRKYNSLISIIMPVYNAGDFLVDAIMSIKKQTVRNWELIAIDDGSTDNSLKMLNRFAKKDKRIRVFKTKHKGLPYALNLGLKKARGEYIARMDADDINHPRRFEIQLKFLEKHRNVILVGTQVMMVDVKGNKIGKKMFPLEHEKIYKMMTYIMPIQHATLMARASHFKQIAYQNHTTAEDVSMFFKMLQKGKMANVKETLYYYRLREGSNSLKNLKKTYYLTLKSRVKAVINWDYKPEFYGIAVNFVEFIIISMLPSRIILELYKFMRFHRFNIKNTIIRIRRELSGYLLKLKISPLFKKA